MRSIAFIVLSACAAAVDDAGPYALEAGDPTALLSGCGEVASVGHIYCRFPEGWMPSGEIVVSFPASRCGEPVCGSVMIYGPDGARVVNRPIEPETTYAIIPWRSLVGDQPLERHRRGFWPVVARWRWLNADGLVEETIVEGEIRLRVHAGNYRPLGAGDAARWRWNVGRVTFAVTTKGRAWVSVKR